MKIKVPHSQSFLKIIFLIISLFFVCTSYIQSTFAVELADVVNFKVKRLDLEKKEVTISLVTKNDFKIYKENLIFEYTSPGAFPENLSYHSTPEAKLTYDPFSNKNKYLFENGTTFVLNIQGNLKSGEKLNISLQACSVDVCLLPSSIEVILDENDFSNFSASSQNTNLKSFSPSSSTKFVKSTNNDIDSSLAETVLKYLQSGSIFLFPILFLAGLLTNLTPCVYPMIPITLSVMNQFGKNEKSHIKLALIYMIGMVITYSILGVAAAMTGQVFGSQLSSPIFNAVVAGIMLLLGFAMLDFFDLSILQQLSYKIPYNKKSPTIAVGTMGAVSGLVAAPCTGPILSMILVIIAQTRAPATGFLYMFSFALGFGIPYVVLGVLSQRINKLPKMNKTLIFIKLFFACLMFGLAFYFLRSLLSESRFFNFLYVKPDVIDIFIVLILLFLCIGIKKPRVKFLSKLGSVGVVATISLLCLWLTLWVSSAFVSPSSRSMQFEDMLQSSKIHWRTNLSEAAKEAIKQNKKLLVDIWAQWCAACLEMEHTTWQDNTVIKIINEKYIPVKIDYTNPTSSVSDLLSKWEILGLPAILIFEPNDLNKPLEVTQGLIKTSKFIDQLELHE